MAYKKEEMQKKKCLKQIKYNEEFMFFVLFISMLLMIPEISTRIAFYIKNMKLETIQTIIETVLYFFTIITTLKTLKNKK